MGNLKRRIERLEGGRKERGIPVIIVGPGESSEEAWQRHLAQHPEDGKAEVRLVIKRSVRDPSNAPQPPRPEPKENPKAPEPARRSIIW